ncbi:hypothetical protein MBLNU230_g5054t1 [Neophaeotheca triangularis]
MHSFIATSLMVGVAFAAPKPYAEPQAVDLTPLHRKNAAFPVYKRQETNVTVPACEAQPAGSGPLTRDPDTAEAFRANPVYAEIAEGVEAPEGYTEAFSGLGATVEQIGYQGLRTLESYDPETCAEICNLTNGCLAFNIYFERDPSLAPPLNATNATAAALGCSNPPSTTTIGCALYGFPISAAAATNAGQFRTEFEVAIAGSNGYTVTEFDSPAVEDDFEEPTQLACALNAPLDPVTGDNTFVGVTTFSNTVFDPALCAAACRTHNAYHTSRPDPIDGTYPPCNYFNSYILSRNDVPESLVCNLYSREWPASEAVSNCGQVRGDDVYTVESSAGYPIVDPLPGGCVPPEEWNGEECV